MQKKFLAFYSIFVIMLCMVLLLPNKTPVFACITKDLEYFNYTYYVNSVDNINKLEDYKIIENGGQYLINCDNKSYFNIKRELKNIKGESISFISSKEQSLNLIKNLNASIVKQEYVDDMIIFYCFSNKLYDYLIINNQKVNIQLAVKGNITTIGYPLILGSF